MALLRVENLSVSYGHIGALKGVSLEVREGEFVTLLGANGAGKSTLLAAVVGVVRAQSGAVWFDGREVTHRPTDAIVAAGISVVPEGRGVLPLMTVAENLKLGAYHVKGDATPRMERVFDRFPILRERRNQPAGTLSGGEQQMLAIARALMAAPRLLVLDEPSLGLAPLMVGEVFDLLRRLKADGQTILLAEQNARKALACADRAYVFQVGRIVLDGTGADLAGDPRVHQAYLGGL